jgi:GT2 family glycosyltransferase
MTLAPIVLFVYNRPWHTKQTITALERNELSDKSELFIFSDEAKNPENIEKVKEVREYIKKAKNFKKITIIKQTKNLGLAASIINGVTNIINKYGKIIVLEDDLVTSPHFLRFMNESLDLYKNEEKVWHITGYRHPLNDKEITESPCCNE